MKNVNIYEDLLKTPIFRAGYEKAIYSSSVTLVFVQSPSQAIEIGYL